MGSHEGAFSAEPAAGSHTHRVMPHLIMLCKMSQVICNAASVCSALSVGEQLKCGCGGKGGC
jgi:hypothetical protein